MFMISLPQGDDDPQLGDGDPQLGDDGPHLGDGYPQMGDDGLKLGDDGVQHLILWIRAVYDVLYLQLLHLSFYDTCHYCYDHLLSPFLHSAFFPHSSQ